MHSDGVMQVGIWCIIRQHKADEMKRQVYSFVHRL